MKPKSLEIIVGGLLVAAIVYVGFIAIHLGKATLTQSRSVLHADFASASGLHAGDAVKIAGGQIDYAYKQLPSASGA